MDEKTLRSKSHAEQERYRVNAMLVSQGYIVAFSNGIGIKGPNQGFVVHPY